MVERKQPLKLTQKSTNQFPKIKIRKSRGHKYFIDMKLNFIKNPCQSIDLAKEITKEVLNNTEMNNLVGGWSCGVYSLCSGCTTKEGKRTCRDYYDGDDICENKYKNFVIGATIISDLSSNLNNSLSNLNYYGV
jgi:hypothetical protein